MNVLDLITARNNLSSTWKERSSQDTWRMTLKRLQARAICNWPNLDCSVTRRCHDTLLNRRKLNRPDSSFVPLKDNRGHQVREFPYASSPVLQNNCDNIQWQFNDVEQIKWYLTSKNVACYNDTSEPLQTRPSLGETARELISLSCAATTALALRGTSSSTSPSVSSQVHILMVRSLIKR